MKQKIEYASLMFFLLAVLLIPVGGIAIDWIQSTERVVGEGHPTYTDVVNRPMKQIWGNFTSEHTLTGTHRPDIFPTLLPTPTPIPANALIDWTNATDVFWTQGEIWANAQPIHLYTFVSESEPDIPADSSCFWINQTTGQYYWILDYGDVQKYVELAIAGRDDSGPPEGN